MFTHTSLIGCVCCNYTYVHLPIHCLLYTVTVVHLHLAYTGCAIIQDKHIPREKKLTRICDGIHFIYYVLNLVCGRN